MLLQKNSIVLRFFLFLFATLYPVCSSCDADHCSAKNQYYSSSPVIGLREELDFELIESRNKTHAGVFSVFDFTILKSGRQRLLHQLKDVTVDMERIEQRKNLVCFLLENPALVTQLQKLLGTIRAHERSFLYFSESLQDPVANNIIKNFYFQTAMLRGLNNYSWALSARRIVQQAALFSPVVEHLIFHFALSHIQEKFTGTDGHDHQHDHHGHACIHSCKPSAGASPVVKGLFSALEIAHFGMHGISFIEMIQHCAAEAGLINKLHHKVIGAHACLCAMADIAYLLRGQHENLKAFSYSTWDRFFNGNSAHYQNLHAFVQEFSHNTHGALSAFSSSGNTLKQYRTLKHAQETLCALSTMVADIDAVVSIVQWIKTTRERGGNVCYVDFIAADTPRIEMQDFWHVALDPATATCNSCEVGGSEQRYIIITGPNKAGKSTLIKAVGLNIMLAQTFGIAAAKKCTMTPFNKVLSIISSADDIAHDASTMVADMARAHCCIETIAGCASHEFTCCIIDDSLFKGTAFDQGQQIAHRFIQELGKHKNSCGFVVTHFDNLKELARQDGLIFKNCYIPTVCDAQGNKKSSFHLTEGVSDGAQVLELVKEQDRYNFLKQ